MSVFQSALVELAPWPILPDFATAARDLIAAQNAMEAHRQTHGWPEIDPRGGDLQSDLDEAQRMFRSACQHHGIDRDALAVAVNF